MENNKDVKVPEVLTPQQALNILIQGVNLAQNKGGVYNLSDAALIDKAVRVFTDQPKTEVANTDDSVKPESEFKAVETQDEVESSEK